MANRKNTFLIKRSNTPGNAPTAGQILLGELALNTADVILYASGTTSNSILPIGWDRVARTGDTMTGTLFTPYLSATTVSATTYLNLPSFTDDYLPLSGGTVYGPTIFSGSLTANTLNVTGLTQTTTFQLTTTPTVGYVLTSDASGNGTWQVGSPIGSPTLRNVTATTTFATPNETVNCTGNTFTVNLPTAVGIQGTTYTLVNSGTGVITLQPNGLETINGSLSIDLSIQYISRTVQSDGSNWIII